MKIACPLCESLDTELNELIDVNGIIYLWKKVVDVAYLFEGCRHIKLLKCKNCTLSFYYPRIAGDDKFYEKIQNISGYYPEEKPEYDYAASYIKSYDKVLEIGSGSGQFSRKLNKTCDYLGLEYNEGAVRKAKINKINVIRESIEKHSVDHKAHYDIAVAFQVLEHVSHIRSFIEATLLTIKEGGRMIIVVPNNDGYVGKLTNARDNMPPHHINMFGENTLKYIATTYNLKIENIWIEPIADFHIDYYKRSFVYDKLRTMVGITPKKLNVSIWNRIIMTALGRLIPKLERFIKIETLGIKGHSVCITLRK